MSDMSHDEIVASLEEVRSGNTDPERVSSLENFLIDLLMSSGKDAVGTLLLGLEGMRFSVAETPEETPVLVFRSDHSDNALIVEVFAVEDIASISITPEKGEVPELPAGHRWFYGVWDQLIGKNVADPLALPEPERTVYLIASFEADVMNGGLGQYLSNTDGKFVEDTVAALEHVCAPKAAGYLRKAAAMKKQTESWDDLWERAGKQLSNLDSKYLNDHVEYIAMMTARHFGKDG